MNVKKTRVAKLPGTLLVLDTLYILTRDTKSVIRQLREIGYNVEEKDTNWKAKLSGVQRQAQCQQCKQLVETKELYVNGRCCEHCGNLLFDKDDQAPRGFRDVYTYEGKIYKENYLLPNPHFLIIEEMGTHLPLLRSPFLHEAILDVAELPHTEADCETRYSRIKDEHLKRMRDFVSKMTNIEVKAWDTFMLTAPDKEIAFLKALASFCHPDAIARERRISLDEAPLTKAIRASKEMKQRLIEGRGYNGSQIILIPQSTVVTPQNIHQWITVYGLSIKGKVFVCDCSIKDIEQETKIPEGFITKDGIVNIDHHADDPRMRGLVSSTPLAIQWVKNHGLPKKAIIVINHVDCDSVLSAAILAGLIPPLEKFSKAAIAADHTGESNRIVDLLQALQPLRNLGFSLKNLDFLLKGHPVLQMATDQLIERRKDKEYLREHITYQKDQRVGEVQYVLCDESIDAGLLSALLPEAGVLVLAHPNRSGQGWNISARLGNAAIGRYTLHDLEISTFDPGFGGRWNAGSNSRAGGTSLAPKEYAEKLNQLISGFINK